MALLIIGIDPGTTLGYAVLDDRGKLIKVDSERNIKMSQLINLLLSQGRPLLIGCDKNPAPGFVEKLAVKLGARLAHPKHDLLVSEKKELIKGFDMKLNAHEQDALASAMYALQKNNALLRKTERLLRKKKKQEYEQDVKLIMMRTEELSIGAALERAEQKNKKQDKPRPKPKKTKQKIVVKPSKQQEEKLVLLQKENQELKTRLKSSKALIKRLKKKLKNEPRDEIVSHKENRIKQYSEQVDSLKKELIELTKQNQKLNSFIGQLSPETVLIKKLKDLSYDEYQSRQFLNISQDDVLMIEDPSSISQKAISRLRSKARIIITGKKIKNPPPGFIFLEKDSLIKQETRHYALINKHELEKALSKKTILQDIIDEYKKQRQGD